jgi:choline dehydrogenase-like flavoprotein
MIDDARQIPASEVLEADICILGGGAAGICLAREFIGTTDSVLLLPGGGPNQTASGLDLYRGAVDPPGSHEPLEENRLRMWGGTTTVWGGRCVPFDPIDFAERPWIPHSGWPITHEEILPYLERANRVSEAGPAEFDAREVFPGTQAEIIHGFDSPAIQSWPLERWSVPTDYSKRYHQDFSSAPNVRVLMHAHGLRLYPDASGDKIEFVEAACKPGKIFSIRAKTFILACGALETARLLLASNTKFPAGIGNENDLVGRFYQSHLFGVCGSLTLNKPTENFIYDFEKDDDGVYCRRRFWLSPEFQEKLQTNNVVGFFFRNITAGSEHRNGMVSLVMLVKTILGGAKKGPRRLLCILKTQREDLLNHAKIVLQDGFSIAPQVAAVIYTRFFQKRRLPMILPPQKNNHFPLFFQTEHAPNYQSRVILDPSQQDEFGLPRLKAQIRFSPIDHHTVRTFIRTFADRVEETGLGEFSLSKDDLAFLENPNSRPFNSNSHNIGTTRMSQDPSAGVVDPNCRVHSTQNLYIASSSVFPTSSHANPTLMIIALAIRLADHLKRLP